MYEHLSADDAARALDEIDRRTDQVIERSLIPGWFWWALAGLNVGLPAAIELGQPLIGTTLFVLGILAVTGSVAANALRHAQVRNNMVSPTGVLAILGFIAAILAISLPTALVLDAHEVRFAATIATALGGVVMVVGGPLLIRYIRHSMRQHRTGTKR